MKKCVNVAKRYVEICTNMNEYVINGVNFDMYKNVNIENFCMHGKMNEFLTFV